MKFALILVFCIATGFSASAQWWKIDLKKHERFPQLAPVKDHSLKRLPAAKIERGIIRRVTFATADYGLELAEAAVMKTAQHHMRFRVYDEASYDFSQLAELYMQQKRFSEAKWYLLQSNSISRQENDDQHTISNLMDLAIVKASLGDVVLAQQDLSEARQMAWSKKWQDRVTAIDNELKYIQANKSAMLQTEFRYADAVGTAKKID
jgi:hypothetical protein